MWVSENEGLFATPPILPLVLTCWRPESLDTLTANQETILLPGEPDEIDDVNDSIDRMIAFELSSKDDLIKFTESIRDLGLCVRAIFDPNVTPMEEEEG